MLNYNPPKIRVWNPHPGLHDFHQDNSRCKTIRENHDPILKTFLNSPFLEYLVIQFVTFEMVKWPFQGVKWPPTRGSKGHFESPGTCYFLWEIGRYLSPSKGVPKKNGSELTVNSPSCFSGCETLASLEAWKRCRYWPSLDNDHSPRIRPTPPGKSSPGHRTVDMIPFFGHTWILRDYGWTTNGPSNSQPWRPLKPLQRRFHGVAAFFRWKKHSPSHRSWQWQQRWRFSY